MSLSHVRCRAPGKIVLWGEYAVLAGAPAVIMAVDRYATVSVTRLEAGWHFACAGFLTPSIHKATSTFCNAPAATFAEAAIRRFGGDQLARPFAYTADTRPFFIGADKLGIGSSAAVCVATYGALARWFEHASTMVDALQIHAQWQGGSGSGLDVAASWHGGVIAYSIAPPSVAFESWKSPSVRPFSLPLDLHWQVVWTGGSANTVQHVRNFEAWRTGVNTQSLEALVDAAAALAAGPADLDALARYSDCLRDLDDAAQLNIFTPEHDQLGRIAAEFGLVYKPCGAGGGDVGIVFGNDPDAVASFAKRVDETECQPISVEIAQHGVEVSD